VAVELAQNIFGDFSTCQVVLVGAGEMAELAARAMVTYGVGSLSILNRTRERAEQLAAEFDARALGWDQLHNALWWADIILASAGAPHAIFRPDNLRPALRMRRGRPLFFIDIAVPRNVDPQVQRLENVYLYDIDDLEAVVETSMDERQREVPKVEAIVADQQEAFMAWLRSLDVVPTIVALREKAESIRQEELESALHSLAGLSERERKVVQVMTKRVINRFLHHPTVRLKERANARDGYAYAEVIRDVFDLDAGGG
jgi:glutamyl-tRNA reductase